MNTEQPISLAQSKSERKPLVLVVDDSPQYGKLFELLSQKLGIDAHIVSSCPEAIVELGKFSYDAVLMDWVMPEIDGLMCTRKIREMELNTGKRIPVIGISGYIGATQEKCLASGMDDFLSVPFSLEQIQEKLGRWLPKPEVS